MAEYFIPPSNSAANQYTESLPTAGGGTGTGDSIGGETTRTPKKVLGDRNAAKLDAQGPEGRAAAEAAAETAPSTIVDDSATGKGQGSTGGKKQGSESDGENAGAGAGGNDSGGGSGSPQSGGQGSVDTANPSGSGGFGEIVGKATGLSGGGSSLLLPLIIVAALAWSIFYAVRQRRQPLP